MVNIAVEVLVSLPVIGPGSPIMKCQPPPIPARRTKHQEATSGSFGADRLEVNTREMTVGYS